MPYGKIKKQNITPNGVWKPVHRNAIADFQDVVNVLDNWGEWVEAWAKEMDKHHHGKPTHPGGKYPPPPPPFEP